VPPKSGLALTWYCKQPVMPPPPGTRPEIPLPQATAHGSAGRAIRPAASSFQKLGFVPAVYRRVLRRVCRVQQADQLVQAWGEDDDES
jgi:hypothetical protein